MSPQMVPDFETRVRKAIEDRLSDSRVSIDYVDEVAPVEGSHGRVLLVDFHLDASDAASDEQFTFPFDESIPLDQSLAVLSDMIARSSGNAGVPPTQSK